MPRAIAHWDADRFFASIEQACDRRLRNRPVAVGGASRGVVLSSSAEARRFGVRPGLPMRRARRLCPALVTVPAHFELYEQFSEQILGLCRETTPLVEPLSVGAAYLDLTGTSRMQGSAAAVLALLHRTARDWLRVSISTGMATSKSVARIAARLRKPAGHLVVPPGGERRFLEPLPLGWLPGLGPGTAALLQTAGLRGIGDLARAPLDSLALVLGPRAPAVQRLAQGLDVEPVALPARPDGAACKETVEFPEDAWEEPFLLLALRGLLQRLMPRVRSSGVEVRRLTLHLRYTDRIESERSVSIAEPSSVDIDFLPLLPELLRSAWTRRVRLRAMSLAAGRVYLPAPQMSLLPSSPRNQLASLALAMDRLRARFGEKAARWGAFAAAPPACWPDPSPPAKMD